MALKASKSLGIGNYFDFIFDFDYFAKLRIFIIGFGLRIISSRIGKTFPIFDIVIIG